VGVVELLDANDVPVLKIAGIIYMVCKMNTIA